ncbi:CCSER1 isoform 12 [Pongo abelii]|uniref:CCSER1 isoform 12 n=1 Tax=Pongo abelii TaxID=9601 RepID=A0A2J8V5E9_PONAB|nr:CCSER1 isoform 12 [Pongo abelii]
MSPASSTTSLPVSPLTEEPVPFKNIQHYINCTHIWSDTCHYIIIEEPKDNQFCIDHIP